MTWADEAFPWQLVQQEDASAKETKPLINPVPKGLKVSSLSEKRYMDARNFSNDDLEAAASGGQDAVPVTLSKDSAFQKHTF